MSGSIYLVKDRNGASATADFAQLLHGSGLLEQFQFLQVPDPVLYFRQDFANYIAKHGLSSMYRFDFVMEDITSPSLSINEIENVVGKFVAQLDGAKRLLIIDPYLYAKSNAVNVADVFKNLLGKACSALEEIIFVTNGEKADVKVAMHVAVGALVPQCKIVDVATDQFHDRFWVDPDAGRGLVMGTSLNGLGRKVALVDRLQDADAVEVATLAKAAGVPL
jgi:hypothetical protein